MSLSSLSVEGLDYKKYPRLVMEQSRVDARSMKSDCNYKMKEIICSSYVKFACLTGMFVTGEKHLEMCFHIL